MFEGRERARSTRHAPRRDQQARLRRYYLGNLIGNPLDTSIAAASLVSGGVLVRTFGSDHVMLGTDYPFDMGDTDPIQTADALELADGPRQQILGGTAARLFGIEKATLLH